MAQFDVYAMPDGSLLLDCQADILNELNTRFVVPLLDPDDAPKIVRGFNPAFEISGQAVVMYTQFSAAVPVSILTQPIDNLAGQHFAILGALDMLITGY